MNTVLYRVYLNKKAIHIAVYTLSNLWFKDLLVIQSNCQLENAVCCADYFQMRGRCSLGLVLQHDPADLSQYHCVWGSTTRRQVKRKFSSSLANVNRGSPKLCSPTKNEGFWWVDFLKCADNLKSATDGRNGEQAAWWGRSRRTYGQTEKAVAARNYNNDPSHLSFISSIKYTAKSCITISPTNVCNQIGCNLLPKSIGALGIDSFYW